MTTSIDAVSFLVIVSAAALAAVMVAVVAPRLTIPVVVVELLLGILLGPEGAGLAEVDAVTSFFGNLGLGMLFFFAGYEIDFERIKGRPLALALAGWGISLAMAYGLGAVLTALGVVASLLYTGSALATTAIGTLIPILRDAGDSRSRFGTYLLGAGAVGEFGPILLITLALSSTNPLNEALILIAFAVTAVLTGVLAVRSIGRGWPALERTLESSSQLAVRLVVVLVFALLTLASDLGLDLLLGGFVAGMISRLAIRGREVEQFESKITALGYGFLVPFFFITSGMNFDLDALVDSPTGMAKVPLFVALFLLVRGAPAMLLYGRVLDRRDRMALAVYSATELPLVVAITTVAVHSGHMQTSTASALVGAGIVSTLMFPLIGLHLRSARPGQADEVDPTAADETAPP